MMYLLSLRGMLLKSAVFVYSFPIRRTMMNNVSLILETNSDIMYVNEEEQSYTPVDL